MRKRSKLLNPFKSLNVDPYTGKKKYKQKGVCTIIWKKNGEYILKNYPSAKNHTITHIGDCGVCSTLQDLKVYKKYKDLTKHVKSCALKGIVSNKKQYNCIKKLGFTPPCAEIWHYNAINTRRNCFWPCILNYHSKYNKKNGDLNKCLKCDEKKSGPIFKQIAGRTRRNSGIKSAIKRGRISRKFHMQSKRRKSPRKKRKSPRKKSQRNICTHTVTFSSDTIKSFKEFLGENHEKSGALYIHNKKIKIKKSSIRKGNDKETDSIDHRYTFHIHPRIAYEKLNTEIGFPSSSDFDVFLDSFVNFNNIFTVLGSIEGIYITMMNLNMKTKGPGRKYIKKYFSIDKTNFKKKNGLTIHGFSIHTPKDFCKYANNCLFENNQSLFKLVFIPWSRATTKSFSFKYYPRKGKCLVNDTHPVKKFMSQYK